MIGMTKLSILLDRLRAKPSPSIYTQPTGTTSTPKSAKHRPRLPHLEQSCIHERLLLKIPSYNLIYLRLLLVSIKIKLNQMVII